MLVDQILASGARKLIGGEQVDPTLEPGSKLGCVETIELSIFGSLRCWGLLLDSVAGSCRLFAVRTLDVFPRRHGTLIRTHVPNR